MKKNCAILVKAVTFSYSISHINSLTQTIKAILTSWAFDLAVLTFEPRGTHTASIDGRAGGSVHAVTLAHTVAVVPVRAHRLTEGPVETLATDTLPS